MRLKVAVNKPKKFANRSEKRSWLCAERPASQPSSARSRSASCAAALPALPEIIFVRITKQHANPAHLSQRSAA